MNLILPTLGKDRQKTYSPFLPICPTSGKVLEIPMVKILYDKNKIIFDDNGKMLAEKGNEFGATTGRPRRCGWLDLFALKKAVFTNSVTDICLTKLDVMDEFNSIEVCIDYQGDQPVYKTFEGWKSSTEGITKFKNLPLKAQEYINFIEDFVGCNISIVSTGPSRDQTIHR